MLFSVLRENRLGSQKSANQLVRVRIWAQLPHYMGAE